MTDIGNLFEIVGIGLLCGVVLYYLRECIRKMARCMSCGRSSQVEPVPVPVQSKGNLTNYSLNKNYLKATLRASAFDYQPGVDDLTGVRTQPLPLPIPEPISTREYPPQYNPDIV